MPEEALGLSGGELPWLALGMATVLLIAVGGFWIVWRRVRHWPGAADPRAGRMIVIGTGVLAPLLSRAMNGPDGGTLIPPLGLLAAPYIALMLSGAAAWGARSGRSALAGPAAAHAHPPTDVIHSPASIGPRRGDRNGVVRGRFWPQVTLFMIAYTASVAITLADNPGDPDVGKTASYTLALLFQVAFVQPVAIVGFGTAWWRARSWPGARINYVGALIAVGAGLLVPAVNDHLRVPPFMEPPTVPDAVLIPWFIFGSAIAALALSMAARLIAAAVPAVHPASNKGGRAPG
ncbi:hypothetical protein [Longimicrobium terrae]|nr:hypothetical protein [Longimicrobium terrae]NNC30164.1 hypothetical protein [Longimicrobium terrae]